MTNKGNGRFSPEIFSLVGCLYIFGDKKIEQVVGGRKYDSVIVMWTAEDDLIALSHGTQL